MTDIDAGGEPAEEAAGAEASAADFASVSSGDAPKAAKARMSWALQEEFDVLQAVGGWRGIAESVVPTCLFLILYIVNGQMGTALIAAVASSLVLIAVRAFQRISVTPALGGLFAIGISAAIAWRTGQAQNFFVWGIITNASYLAILLISLAVRWPAVGLVFGALRGDTSGWRKERTQRRRYWLLTWMWVAFFAARVVVQLPLYLAHATEALGVARLVMGVPLFALTAWFTWLGARDLRAAGE